MNAKNISVRYENPKQLSTHLSSAAFLEAARACGVFFVGDHRLTPLDEADLFIDAMHGLTQSMIAKAAAEVEIVPAGTEVAFRDKDPTFDGPKVNCDKPVTLSLKGPWNDQSKRGWARARSVSSIELRNTLITLATLECASAECPGSAECGFVVDGGIDFGNETDSDDRTTRIRAVVTIEGKCACPGRQTAGGSD